MGFTAVFLRCAMRTGKPITKYPLELSCQIFDVLFRWATIPVVKVAQAEKLVDFPAELDVPWKFFQRQFGFTSLGGNVVSNFLCNFDAEGRIQYQINSGMSDMIQRAEYHFGHMFVELEALVSLVLVILMLCSLIKL